MSSSLMSSEDYCPSLVLCFHVLKPSLPLPDPHPGIRVWASAKYPWAALTDQQYPINVSGPTARTEEQEAST